jgi:predicted transcriptional regulator
MPKIITIRLRDATYRELKRRAEAANRAISNHIETAALRYVREADFVSEDEMAGILADEALVRRLRRGSREAKARKGRLVG